MTRLDILYEDNHLLVVNKPAGLITQGAEAGESSLVTMAKEYLKAKYQKPGNVYLGVVSRLDSLVTGVVVLARTSKAAARLNEQFREAEVAKTYWAIVEGTPTSDRRLVDWLVKDESQHKMVVVPAKRSGATEARLSFRVLERLAKNRSLLEVNLETGRKHQIRCQLANCGFPILGDRKYGATTRFAGIALHARRLRIAHPTLKNALVFRAPLPKSWEQLGFSEDKVAKYDLKEVQ